MATIILYVDNPDYLQATVDSILDYTPDGLLDELLVVHDEKLEWTTTRPKVSLLRTGAGRAVSWAAGAAGKSGQLVFVGGTLKASAGWIEPLLQAVIDAPTRIACPKIHSLDPVLWASGPEYESHWRWRWDLSVYGSQLTGESPAMTPACFAIDAEWLAKLGGLDVALGVGDGESLELAIRCWMCGGSVESLDDSVVSAAPRSGGPKTRSNLARIAELWLGSEAERFYTRVDEQATAFNPGRFPEAPVVYDLAWYISTLQPELRGIHKLRRSAAGRSVAIVDCWASIDVVIPAWIARHDILIGVDRAGLLYDCDYVVASDALAIRELLAKYDPARVVAPTIINGPTGSALCRASDLNVELVTFEAGRLGIVPDSADDPLCNFDSAQHFAVHFALFLGASRVSLFGCDNQLSGEVSHTAKLSEFHGGKYFADSPSMRKRFEFWEFGLRGLGQLARSMGVSVLRTSSV